MTEPMKLADVLEEIERNADLFVRGNDGEPNSLDRWAAAIRKHLAEDEAREREWREIMQRGRTGGLYDVADGPALLPCPFCGGEAKHFGMGAVGCSRCHACCVNEFSTDRWNRRTP